MPSPRTGCVATIVPTRSTWEPEFSSSGMIGVHVIISPEVIIIIGRVKGILVVVCLGHRHRHRVGIGIETLVICHSASIMRVREGHGWILDVLSRTLIFPRRLDTKAIIKMIVLCFKMVDSS